MDLTALSSQLPRAITEEEIANYEADGAAILRQVLPMDWIDVMRDAIETILEEPGKASVEYTPEGKKGRYVGDFFTWMRNPVIEAFIKDSPMPALAAAVMRSNALNFFYDQLLGQGTQYG